MDKQVEIYLCHGILLNNKEEISNMPKSMKESQNYFVNWKKSDTRLHSVWFLLCEILEKAKV